MKLSVSLSQEDLERLDRYVRASGLRSRSAAIQRAIRLLGDGDLEADYAEAWDEWAATGEEAARESTTGDGVVDVAR